MTGHVADEVVLAVGHEDCDAAIAFVAAEIERVGGEVRVAHAVLPLEHRSVPPPLTIEDDTVRVVGTRVLGSVAARLEHALPEVPVHTDLLHGPASHAVVEASRLARRVVLERRPRSRGHVHTLAITGNVAAHAHAPVVVVPPGWRPSAERERTVVVGVDDVLTSPQLLETALDEAAARGAQLVVVHAWHYSDTYDEVAFAGVALEHHEEELRRNLTRELEPALKRHPHVPARLVVRHGRPADVLLEESAQAGLVVLGRHHASVPWGSHLGSVVRAVLRESATPVLVLDSMAPRPPDRDDPHPLP
jgi:nucleotide-binding universal stress UspA family protein